MVLQRLEIVEMIDWYDGIVLALVSTTWMEGTYLCSLLAFDVELKKRVFALLPLNDNEISEIRSRLGGEWEALLSYLKLLWDNASGNAILVCYRDTDEQVIADKVVSASELVSQAISDIEEAVSDERRLWLEMF